MPMWIQHACAQSMQLCKTKPHARSFTANCLLFCSVRLYICNSKIDLSQRSSKAPAHSISMEALQQRNDELSRSIREREEECKVAVERHYRGVQAVRAEHTAYVQSSASACPRCRQTRVLCQYSQSASVFLLAFSSLL